MKKIIVFAVVVCILLSGYAKQNSDAPKSTADEIPAEYAQIGTANGVNVMGNTVGNRNTGGFITHQGDYVYYANFNDKGNLYAAKKDGKDALKLTDFPVANINVAGDVLTFTDISFCEYYKDGSYGLVKNKSYDELFSLVNNPGQLSPGGSLYIIYKPLENNEPEMKVLAADSEKYYEGMILTSNVLSYMAVPYGNNIQVVPTAAPRDSIPGIQLTARSVNLPVSQGFERSGGEEQTDWFGSPVPSQRDALQMNTEDTNSWRRWAAPLEGGIVAGPPLYTGGDSLYVTVFTPDGDKSYIYRYNINTKTFVSAVEGHSIASNGNGDVFFLNPEGYVYKYDTSADDSGQHTLVEGVRGDHLVSTTGKDVMLSYNVNGEWYTGKVTTDNTSPEIWYAAPSVEINQRVPWSWKSGDIMMNYDFNSKGLYMSEFNKAWKAQDNKTSTPTAKKYKMSELAPPNLNSLDPVRDDMVIPTVETADKVPPAQETPADNPSAEKENPAKQPDMASGNTGSMVVEKVSGTGNIFDNNKQNFPVKVGEKVNLTDRVAMNSDSFCILNVDGVNRLAILSSKASVLSNSEKTVISMPDGLNILIGNPAEDKPFELILNHHIVKSKGGLMVAHDGIYPIFFTYKGAVDLYDKNGNFLGTLEEGGRYEMDKDGKPFGSMDINYRFVNYHGKSNYPLVVDLAREEAYLKSYFDAKNEEYKDKY